MNATSLYTIPYTLNLLLTGLITPFLQTYIQKVVVTLNLGNLTYMHKVCIFLIIPILTNILMIIR